MFCRGVKGIFENFNTNSRISLGYGCYLRYVLGRLQGYRIALPDLKQWLLTRNNNNNNNNNLIEFKVHLIHSKKVPLLHNTALFYAIKETDWWPCI